MRKVLGLQSDVPDLDGDVLGQVDGLENVLVLDNFPEPHRLYLFKLLK